MSVKMSVAQEAYINPQSNNLEQRILPPKRSYRTKASKPFDEYLRALQLKPHGSLVQYYNGESKNSTSFYCAVFDLFIGKKDLHQCADAIIRLKADYHYTRKEYDQIAFNFYQWTLGWIR